MSVVWPRPDLHFLQLPTSVFCVQCELISHNNTTHCLACGSSAVLSLSRLLGGSIREPRATLLQDENMDRLVRELLDSVPPSPDFVSNGALIAARNSHEPQLPVPADVAPALLDLEPAISVLAERAQSMTGATGSAIGLLWGQEFVCSARAGRTAPDLGVRLQADSGLSGECVRTGHIIRCDDTEEDRKVDPSVSRHLGVRSILVAPLQHFRRTLGLFEVLSSEPFAFDDLAVANLQMLAGFMVAAIARVVGGHSPKALS